MPINCQTQAGEEEEEEEEGQASTVALPPRKSLDGQTQTPIPW